MTATDGAQVSIVANNLCLDPLRRDPDHPIDFFETEQAEMDAWGQRRGIDQQNPVRQLDERQAGFAIRPQVPDGSLSVQQKNDPTLAAHSDSGDPRGTTLAVLTTPGKGTEGGQRATGIDPYDVNANDTARGRRYGRARVDITASRRCMVLAVAASVTIVSALLSPSAAATPPDGATGSTLSKQTIDGKDYIVSEITIQPGGSTGWHTHQGVVYGLVKAGTLTRFDADCAVESVANPGDAITDPSGHEHVHVGRNLGTTPVVLDVTYIDLSGAPTTDSVANPGCDFN